MSTVTATPDDLRGLVPEELEPQGKFFMNGFPMRVADTPAAFRVLPPKAPVAGLTIMTLVIIAVFVGFWVMFHRLAPEDMTWPFRTLLVLIGLLAVGGALGGHLLRLRHLWRRGVLLEFDKQARRVHIDGGRRDFAADEVICVQSLTSGESSELNLITRAADRRERHLLVTDMDSRRTCFDYILLPLVRVTDLRVLRVWRRAAFLGRGELVVEELRNHLKSPFVA